MTEKAVIFRAPDGRELTEAEALNMDIVDAAIYANAIVLDVAPILDGE